MNCGFKAKAKTEEELMPKIVQHAKELLGETKSDLWRRQMVLGPSPQYCVHSIEPLNFPENFRPFGAKIRAVVNPPP